MKLTLFIVAFLPTLTTATTVGLGHGVVSEPELPVVKIDNLCSGVEHNRGEVSELEDPVVVVGKLGSSAENNTIGDFGRMLKRPKSPFSPFKPWHRCFETRRPKREPQCPGDCCTGQ